MKQQISIPLPDAGTIRKISVRVFGVLLLVYIAYLVRAIWLPLGLAFLLAMILDPVVDRMERRGWSRQWASAFIFGSFLLISIGLSVLAFPKLLHQVDIIQVGFEKYFPDPSTAGLQKSFHRMGLPATITNAAVSTIENGRTSVSRSSSWISDYGMPLISNAIWIVIVPIVAFYALRDFHTILAKGLLLIPPRRRTLVQTAVTEITSVFARYLRGLAIVSILNGIATAALLAIIGIPGALLLGVVAGLLYSVPYLGALLTLVITAAVSFVGGGPHEMVVALGLSIVLHQIVFDQIVTPRILGGHVGLHPILSIVALLVGNLLLGIAGMILAVPVAACIQIAVLAVIPKLSRDIDLSTHPVAATDTVTSLEIETKETHIRQDATEEMHTAVANVVQAIEDDAQEQALGSEQP